MNLSKNEERDYVVIGLGSCGSVFEVPGTEIAVKKGKDTKALWNDFRLTNAVYNAFEEVRFSLRVTFPENTIPKVPFCSTFLTPKSLDLRRFPSSHHEAGAALFMDRILPLPQATREALIDTYFDPETRDEAKNDQENQACLVRIYLGENESVDEVYDSLRNFPLRLNMIEDLGLDVAALADEMAIALAVIHWQAQVDAMDAEFVLGSPCTTPEIRQAQEPAADEEPHDVHTPDFPKRSVHMWVLDFDKSKKIEPTVDAIHESLVPAFIGNDPYYPRPDVDHDLWVQFGNTYTKASRTILKRKGASSSMLKLPQLFLDAVAAKIKEHEDWDPAKDIVFG
ncbi:MAG: hypothetical protein Q9224_006713 [Gallowayella concinna]